MSVNIPIRSEEHTSELQSHLNLVCRLLLEKKKDTYTHTPSHTHPQPHSHTHTHTRTHTRLPPHTHPSSPPSSHPHPLTTTLFFFFNDTAPTEIYTLSLHDALSI